LATKLTSNDKQKTKETQRAQETQKTQETRSRAKFKNWTARRFVKISCLTLIPVLLFISSIGMVGIATMDNASTDLLFTNFDKNDYFFDNYVNMAVSYARSAFWLQSEENIKNMGCLEWELSNDGYDGEFEYVNRRSYDLISRNWYGKSGWGTIYNTDIDSAEAKRMVEDAIQEQLRELKNAKNQLETMPGLRYYISDGSRWIGNVQSDAGLALFRDQPVYFIHESGKADEYSRGGGHSGVYPVNIYDEDGSEDSISCYIGFTSEMVQWQNNVWRRAQYQFAAQLALITVPLILTFALVIILIAGAGREYGSDAGGVNFRLIDKPWVDISLCAVIGYEAVVGYLIYRAMHIAWRYENMWWIYSLAAIASVAMALPALWWMMSFVKRCKAGKFWRYTLIYALVSRIFNVIAQLIRSIWAGTRLTVRVVVVGVAIYVVMTTCFIIAFNQEEPVIIMFFMLIALAALLFPLLRYARKLHTVEQGARAATDGRYDPIVVSGGELGSIAASINNISNGINIAVAERMKSERFKAELITNISHDIRTPLTSLITYTDLLKNEGLDNERAQEYLDILIQKSARLKTLTDDLFEASKAASGNIEVTVGTLDLAVFIRQVLGEMEEKLSGSGLDFRLNLPECATVRADGRLLWRVMENLLANVFKYALKGSRVYIDVTPDTQGTQGVQGITRGTQDVQSTTWGTQGAQGTPGVRVYRLDIKNMSQHPLNIEPEELMERFKRGDEARSGEGSGLGLSIAQSFVTAQGGRFSLSIDGDLFKASIYLPGA